MAFFLLVVTFDIAMEMSGNASILIPCPDIPWICIKKPVLYQHVEKTKYVGIPNIVYTRQMITKFHYLICTRFSYKSRNSSYLPVLLLPVHFNISYLKAYLLLSSKMFQYTYIQKKQQQMNIREITPIHMVKGDNSYSYGETL